MSVLPVVTFLGYEIPALVSFDMSLDIESMVNTISIAVPRINVGPRFPPELASALTWHGGSLVEAYVDGEIIFTGYVTNSSDDGSADGRQISIEAESRPRVLVNSTFLRGRTFKDRTILQIVEDLARGENPVDPSLELGIEVEVDDSATTAVDTVIPTFKVQYGESYADAIRRALDYEGLLAYSAPSGALTLARASSGEAGEALRYPSIDKRVASRTVSRDFGSRWSHYYVASGDRGIKTDDDASLAVAVDEGMTHSMWTVIDAGADRKTQPARQKYADWTRTKTAGQAFRYEANIVGGWRTRTGSLWTPNTRARVIDMTQRIDADLLITRVSFMRDPQTATVQLELAPPQAFDPLKKPLPRKRDASARDPGEFPQIKDVEELLSIDESLTEGGDEFSGGAS